MAADTTHNVRTTLEQLPRGLAALAEPIWGTRLRKAPVRHRSPMVRLLTAAGMVAVGVAAGFAAFQSPWAIWLLLISALLTTGGARYLQIVIHHYAVHNRFFRKPLSNRLLGQTISTVLLTQDYDGFYVDHIKKHHPNAKLARRGDPDLETLLALGIVPGVPRVELWRRFVRIMVSPRYHAMFMMERLRSNFVTAPPLRRLAAITFWSGVLIFLALIPGAVAPFVAAYLIPITVGYHIAALMQFTSEHVWLTPCRAGDDVRSRARRATRGRFCGDPLPKSGLRGRAALAAWAYWWLRLVTVHAASRAVVLHGDLPNHDLHHIRPVDFDWANPEAERLAMAADYDLWEVWGLWNALDQTFQTLSELDVMEESATPASYNAIAFGSM